MVYVYTLLLEQNKYYVGKTDNPRFRIESHFDASGSAWTKKYPPLKLLELIPDCDHFDEDKYTKIYMNKYGINNVRGGSFCQIKLPKYQIDSLKKELDTATDRCYICGESGHFANKCSNKEKTLDDELQDIKEIFIKLCKVVDLDKSGKLSLDNILLVLQESSDMFSDLRMTNIRGLCQTNNGCEALTYIDYSKGIIRYIDFIDGLIYILLNDPKICDMCGQEGHTDDNCSVYETKKKYKKKYYESESDSESDSESEYDSWECSYCGKLFDTLKGAKYHENVYCKKKKLASSKTKSNTKACYRCGRNGHFSNYCYASKHIKGYYL